MSISLTPECLRVLRELVDKGICANRSEAVRFCVLVAGRLILGESSAIEDFLAAVKNVVCPECGGPLRHTNGGFFECRECGGVFELRLAARWKLWRNRRR